MARLVLKFENAVLKEVSLGSRPVTIGRAPDNDIRIDNLAVSDHHARVYSEGGQLKVEDLDSLNGITLNRFEIKREPLYSGDEIGVGKHVIVVDLEHDAWGTYDRTPKVTAPKLEETVVLGSRRKTDSAGPHPAPGGHETKGSARARIPSLTLVKGKASRREYRLTGKLAVIGKSPMATIQLLGWFSPWAAAQISQRVDGYYLSRISRRALAVNGTPVTDPVLLKDGDLIQVGGVALKFVYGA